MIFKLLLKSIALTVILIAVFSYGIYLKTGKWSGPNLKQFSLPDLPELSLKLKAPDIKLLKIKANIPVQNKRSDKKVYKWQDEKGVWHYETQKPSEQEVEELVQ